MEKTIVLYTVIICSILLILQIIVLLRHSKVVKATTLPTACAGSPNPGTPKNVAIQNFFMENLQIEDSNPRINLNDNHPFWVQGNSMLLCGIKNDDILATRPIKIRKIKDLPDLPRVLVLKREGKSLKCAIKESDYAKYKIRRTWAILPFDEEQIMAKVEEIMQDKIFLNLKNAHPDNFLSNEKMKNDCRIKRIAKYKREYPNCKKASSKDNLVLISTTLREINGESKVFFSIHPARIAVSEAMYTFHKSEKAQVA